LARSSRRVSLSRFTSASERKKNREKVKSQLEVGTHRVQRGQHQHIQHRHLREVTSRRAPSSGAFSATFRLLAELVRLTDREVFVHGATHALVEMCREAGVAMSRWRLQRKKKTPLRAVSRRTSGRLHRPLPYAELG
jgi:hypothetical protein